MSEIVELIGKIEDKVWKSGCGYLYEYYDELVRLLESAEKENLTGEEIGPLRGLVSKYACESTWDNSSSVSWIWYSVRSWCLLTIFFISRLKSCKNYAKILHKSKIIIYFA